jgi:hypothetical protein
MASLDAASALPPNAFEDVSGTVIGVVSFCLAFATLMVGLRLWTRKIIDQMGMDDYAIILGLVRPPFTVVQDLS